MKIVHFVLIMFLITPFLQGCGETDDNDKYEDSQSEDVRQKKLFNPIRQPSDE